MSESGWLKHFYVKDHVSVVYVVLFSWAAGIPFLLFFGLAAVLATFRLIIETLFFEEHLLTLRKHKF